MIQLGDNPWLLILLSLLEILFPLIPAIISSQISKTSIKHELHQIGIKINLNNFPNKLLKGVEGVIIGIGLLILSPLILYFFQDLILTTVFNEEFVIEGIENRISTQIINPNLLQVFIYVLIQFFIIGPCEESFFRGFIITKLKNKMHLTYTIIISSLSFAFFHVPPFLVPISTIISFFGYYFTLGFILSLLFIYFNYSLIPSSLAHSMFNFLLLFL